MVEQGYICPFCAEEVDEYTTLHCTEHIVPEKVEEEEE